jgi:hypothetical protein
MQTLFNFITKLKRDGSTVTCSSVIYRAPLNNIHSKIHTPCLPALRLRRRSALIFLYRPFFWFQLSPTKSQSSVALQDPNHPSIYWRINFSCWRWRWHHGGRPRRRWAEADRSSLAPDACTRAHPEGRSGRGADQGLHRREPARLPDFRRQRAGPVRRSGSGRRRADPARQWEGAATCGRGSAGEEEQKETWCRRRRTRSCGLHALLRNAEYCGVCGIQGSDDVESR